MNWSALEGVTWQIVALETHTDSLAEEAEEALLVPANHTSVAHRESQLFAGAATIRLGKVGRKRWPLGGSTELRASGVVGRRLTVAKLSAAELAYCKTTLLHRVWMSSRNKRR